MEESRLRVVENSVLRKIFGPKIDMWRGLVNAGMYLQVPKNAENFLTSSEPVNFSTRTLLHEIG
jgi:hypothetical protein